MRPAVFAGTFYPATEPKLRAALEEAFTGERGPGSLPLVKKTDRKVLAVIAPHAGYQYSGQAAAWAYHAIASSPKPDVFIILGPNHDGKETATTKEVWETPLGPVRSDQEFLNALVAKGNLKYDDKTFQEEHSIEVQLPFLAFLYGEHVKIAPVIIGNDADLHQLALDIKEVLVDQGKKASFIVSSDFTHHGPAYKHVRWSQETQKNIYEFDEKIIALIKQQKPAELLDFLDKELATVCGGLPIALLLTILKPCAVKLEQYYTSGDLVEDYKNSVSYAAIVFEEK